MRIPHWISLSIGILSKIKTDGKSAYSDPGRTRRGNQK